MNTERIVPPSRRVWARLLALVAVLVAGAVFAMGAWALSQPAWNYEGPPDYLGYDLNKPWFDGVYWPWFLDMMNQPSVKPQEEGTIQRFPEDSVPRTGVEPFIDAAAMVGGQLARDLMPKNPLQATPASIANGRFIFETYCEVCHGKTGMAGTPVAQKGMPAVPIAPMLPVLTPSHLYNKALYGGPLMPSYGFQTTRKDRWDLVNYLKSPQFGK